VADSEQFDTVIVGAGSAGCVLAERLSADPRRRVALLEAGGPDRNPWLHVPGGFFRIMDDPRVDWRYTMAPARALDGRVLPCPRGRVLGGSSSINGLVYIRGQQQDFEQWRQLGCTGWGWDDVLPHFRREFDQERGADGLHGTGGPLKVADLREDHPLARAMVDAAVEAGLERNEDFNSARQDGAGLYQLTARGRWRSSAARAYLRQARRRPNLRLLTHATATRVLLEGRRAVGIAYERDGETATVRAGVVILALGAIASPQLLQLSGIGPAAHLAAHGIAVAHDLPGVGANLQDHVLSRIVHRVRDPITYNDVLRSPWRRLAAGLDYALRGRGPLTVGAGQMGAFARTREGLATPDVQYHGFPVSFDKPGRVPHPFPGVTLNCYQLRPESRGSVLIESPDPYAQPAIDPNFLDTETDRATLIAGLRMGRRIMAAPAIAPLLDGEVLPGPETESDADWLAHIRARGASAYHPVGTCKMGTDPMAVAGPDLKVHGIERLRIADGSIMPTLVSGNTNAACIMIGARAAEIVLEKAA